eukprot:CAMPEP_0177319048 /NCGR_PEP_ID=MMETSP0368-20130122/14402_1 /TAXON_ID=447022 ORGANISM="Scrippsiella hangoei-like, Strain SHHI-4" /NCGR_SAMPLE_ID=MMETSP0368 /ASSEMBLY_ACC=CAM_ASM_000363 /LENGTH=368 /DNA_ID=CAMNT_0018778523 /DNA_START=42 /DNA_END=1146 /DNA_ORIENTATION=+
MSERMECTTCGYKCTPQWLNDEAHCLKCQTVLRRRDQGAGVGSGTAVSDGARRQVGEASTFKTDASDAREFEGGAGCAKSPTGIHLYKFGKCSHCQQPEPSGAARARPAPAAKPASSPRPAAKPASSPRPAARPSSSPRPAAKPASSPRPVAAVCEDGSGSASAAEPADRNDRAKVECHLCGYKSVPQWLNDKAHCLKCQAVLKTQQTVHGSTDGKLHPTTQRQAGEVSTFKHSAGSAMESESGDCSKAPTGSHHWKFGKCEFCGKAEGILVKGPGVTANPGGVGGCDKGGKCIFKFSKARNAQGQSIDARALAGSSRVARREPFQASQLPFSFVKVPLLLGGTHTSCPPAAASQFDNSSVGLIPPAM